MCSGETCMLLISSCLCPDSTVVAALITGAVGLCRALNFKTELDYHSPVTNIAALALAGSIPDNIRRFTLSVNVVLCSHDGQG